VTLDAVGDLLIVDTTNYLVRFVPVTSGTYFGQSMSADDIYTIAGTGTSGYSGNGGPTTSAKFANVLDVSLERSGLLDDARYIRDLESAAANPSGENVYSFAAAAAAAEVLQFLATIVQPAGVEGIDPQIVHFANGSVDSDLRECAVGCIYNGIWFARGDSLDITVTDRHHAAENVRASRATMRTQSLSLIRRFSSRMTTFLRRAQVKERREFE